MRVCIQEAESGLMLSDDADGLFHCVSTSPSSCRSLIHEEQCLCAANSHSVPAIDERVHRVYDPVQSAVSCLMTACTLSECTISIVLPHTIAVYRTEQNCSRAWKRNDDDENERRRRTAATIDARPALSLQAADFPTTTRNMLLLVITDQQLLP